MNFRVVSKTRLIERSFFDRFGIEGIHWRRVPDVDAFYCYAFLDEEDAIVAKLLAT